MAQAYKICPICKTPNHRNASVCITCGATLVNARTVGTEEPEKKKPSSYEDHFGETDLLEAGLRWRGGTYIVGGLVFIAALICVGSAFVVTSKVLTSLFQLPDNNVGVPTIVPTKGSDALIFTNTPLPTTMLSTVTPAPPTATASPSPTLTPTQGPCIQEVQPNDSLIAIIYRCGYRSIDSIMDIVVELNDLEDASRIQPGQVIEVPWPTPTSDPAAPTTAASSENSQVTEGEQAVVDANDPGAPAVGLQPQPTLTLQPGVMWHRVQPDESMLSIAYNYGANLKILSELNPEITFSQCDFGSGSGGPNCIVQIAQGQMIRVPAPSPTPTLSPTPSGSETPTPTPTPTFNAPTALSPSDRAFFSRDELVTLRWVASGTLSSEQMYQVQIEDVTAGQTYVGMTRELYFIVPEDWHSQQDDRHDYVWTVSVIDAANPNEPYFTTEPRRFTWQARRKS